MGHMGLSQHGRGLEAEGLELPRDPCVPEVGRENHVRSRSPNLGTLLHRPVYVQERAQRHLRTDSACPGREGSTRPTAASECPHLGELVVSGNSSQGL